MPTTDPAGTDDGGTDDGVGVSAPTLAAAGVYIPIAGASSAAAEIVDPEGAYSLTGASAPTTDRPAGTDGGAGASAPMLAAAGAYIPITEASSAAEIVDPEGDYSLAGVSAPTTDPAGRRSAAGVGAPRLVAPGMYSPATGASSAAEIVEPEGAYSLAGASAPTTDLAGGDRAAPMLATPSAHIPETGPTAAAAQILSPPGTYLPPGHSAPIADPGGTYSAAGASAPTTDPAGTYSSPYALNRVYIEWENIVPASEALAFTDPTEVANYFGTGSVEASEANTFFDGGVYDNIATMYFVRDQIGQRPHDLGGNLAGDTLAQLQAINGTLNLSFDGFTYSGNVNLSNVSGTEAQAVGEAATDVAQALNAHRQTAGTITGTISEHTVTFIGSIDKAQLTVDSIISGGPIIVGGIVDGPGVDAPGTNTQIIHDHEANGSSGAYSLFHSNHGNVPEEEMTETYGVLTPTGGDIGAVATGLQLIGNGLSGLSPQTAIPYNDDGQWIVNNGQNIGPETLTLKAPLIGVYEDRVARSLARPRTTIS